VTTNIFVAYSVEMAHIRRKALLKFHVPTLQDQAAADELKATLLTSEPNAKVEIDVQSKTVTVESEASEETFNELIVASGHSIDDANDKAKA